MRSLQLLALMALLATAAKADPFSSPYYAISCGGPGQVACSIVQGGSNYSTDLSGLNAALLTFFNNNLGLGLDQNTDFTSSLRILGNSDDGYVVGNIFGGPDSIDTGFIYHNGQVSCCLTDEPFALTGINDQGVIIGYNPYLNGPFIAAAASANPEDAGEYFLNQMIPSLGFDFDGSNSYFYAIDNQNRILADINGQQDMLIPTGESVPTPEPASVLLLGIGLILCASFLRSRMRRPAAFRSH
jgi:hypothetical protein